MIAWQNLNALGGLSRFWSKTDSSDIARRVADSAVMASRRREVAVRWAFYLIVVIPTVLATVYYALIASPRYVSEAQYVVRGVSSTRVGGLNAFFQTFGISRTVDDSNVVESYILSRDAVRALEARLPLRKMFGRKEADLFARFPRFWESDNLEDLYEYYLDHVTVVDDTSKGISTLRVITFRPEDSVKVARTLMSLAEDLANRMNLRAQQDTVVAAEKDVELAEAKVLSAQAQLTKFRNSSLLVDPSKKSDLDLQTTADLWSQLTQTLTQIHETSVTAPTDPEISVWRAKADALRSRIAAERAKVAGAGEDLGAKSSEYERLTLMRGLADKSLSAAIDSLELARQEARRKQIYVDEIDGPSIPDDSTEPQRLRMIATVFVLTFSVFSVLWILSVGAKEHKNEM